MSASLERQLRAALEGSPLADRLARSGAVLLEAHGKDLLTFRDARVVRGLARAVSSSPETARFLAHRPGLLARIADLDTRALLRGPGALCSELPSHADLELFLDGLRLFRREGTGIAGCLDLGDALPWGAVSDFLTELAEISVARTLHAARQHAAGGDPLPPMCILGLGKIAGREFTYHSDLDLVFLHEGPPQAIESVSRVAQRMIAYLGTMTGAGVAYSVDTRLRPSGQQGALVTSLRGFERYQVENAELWEHLALMRARPLAGNVAAGREALARARRAIFAKRVSPWTYVADVRRRIESERARELPGAIDIKTGVGGLVDVEFLAQGGMVECGAECEFPLVPSVPSLLTAVQRSPRVERLLRNYARLRRIEARARWLSGRPVDRLARDDADLDALAELIAPGLGAEGLWKALETTRGEIREAFQRVIAAGSVRALR